MADDFDDAKTGGLLPRRRPSWGAVIGAAFGLFLGVVGFRWGLGAVLVCLLLALVGGLAGSLWIRE